MTASKSRKATLAVTAGLVGALTLGGVSLAAAPTVAFAEEGAQLQSDWTTGAKVTKATDGKGAEVSDPVNATFGKAKGRYLVPTEVVNSFGTVTPMTNANDYDFRYIKVGDAAVQVDAKAGNFGEADSYFGTVATTGTYNILRETPRAGPRQLTF